ncbi:amidohydrolase family protein [Ruegeria sp. WL0004]|uniref:Amidohydrolase family protein n=1 Tax=Ruegeria marisflavi TaxID=2984152 RepID=A0ABT2X2Y1_9RHOB|nr:amidohydrolase family protein [Ruegeria sp. WL0004]MCU9840433.1 amidohydrolase family protein [Ruegeria sp. WL0004]
MILRIFALATALLTSSSTLTLAQSYDLVIKNGRVMDPETGFDRVANVGVVDGTISAITEEDISGSKEIDASGLVVAPGFIDMHNHVGGLPFGQKQALRDGVTTQLELEAGAYPISLYYERLEGKSKTNYGASVSVLGIRESVMNPDYNSKYGSYLLDGGLTEPTMDFTLDALQSRPDSDQIAEIVQRMEEGLKQGGLGFGNPVGYATANLTSQEMVEMHRLAGEYGSFSVMHGRFSSNLPPTTGIMSVQEALSSVAIYGGGLYVSHIHQQTLRNTPYALDMIKDARSAGIDVVAAIYPYNFGASVISADYLDPLNYGPNMGRSYEDITEQATMQPLTKERYEELIANEPTAPILFVGVEEEIMLEALADPKTLVESDAFTSVVSATGETAVGWDVAYEEVQAHPRAAGSHAKVLRLVREQDLMPLMLAVSKMTYMPAVFMERNGVPRMAKKGRIQKGADADITIFDPENVADMATEKRGGLASEGIPYVIVNGSIVVDDSRVVMDVFPGQPIRGDLN